MTTSNSYLTSILAELDRQRNARVDVVVDTRHLRFAGRTLTKDTGSPTNLAVFPGNISVNEWLDKAGHFIMDQALSQIAERVNPGIPVLYLRKLAGERPHTAASLLNECLPSAQGKPVRWFLRLLDNKLRAVLSDSYRVIDHYEQLFFLLTQLKETGGVVVDASLSPSRMYVRWTSPTHSAPLPSDRNGLGEAKRMKMIPLPSDFQTDRIYPYAQFTNSETGHGGCSIQYGFFTPRCTNGLILDTVCREIHLGQRLTEGLYQQDTRQADATAIRLKLRDHIHSTFQSNRWDSLIRMVTSAANDRILSPTGAVDHLISLNEINESDRDALLSHFLADYTPTRYGLAQAISRFSQDKEDPDTTASLQSLAGRVIREPAVLTA